MYKVKAFYLVILLLCSFLLSSCGETDITDSFYSMGTYCTQKAYGAAASLAIKNAKTTVEGLDALISYRDEQSELFLLNRDGAAELSETLCSLLLRSLEISEMTGGAYDISLLPVVQLWGFDTGDMKLPEKEPILSALKNVGYSKLTVSGLSAVLSPGTTVELSACGKGAACDMAVLEYKKQNVSGIVAVGGSLGICGNKDGRGFTVGIRSPFDTGSIIATLSLSDTFVSTSGSYEKKFSANGTAYHHILDPKTGYPVENELVSVSVVCSSGMLSDALSTAFFVMGIESSLPVAEHFGAQVVFVTKDGKLYATEGITGSISTDSVLLPAEDYHE